MNQAFNDVLAFMRIGNPDALRTTPQVPTTSHPGSLEVVADQMLATKTYLLRDTGNTSLGARLMLEELAETLQAMAKGDTAEMADGLADLVYVTVFTALLHGVDLRPVWAEVQRANMSKFPTCDSCDGDGKGPISDAKGACLNCGGLGREALRNDAGKIIKPNGWQPPDIREILRLQKDLK